MTLGVRVVATGPDGRVCLVRHTYTPGLHFPGGGVERDQTIYEAAASELLQETGLAAECEAFRLRGVYLNQGFRGDHIALLAVAGARQVSDPDAREISEVVWANPAEPPKDATSATRMRLRELAGEAPASPDWP